MKVTKPKRAKSQKARVQSFCHVSIVGLCPLASFLEGPACPAARVRLGPVPGTESEPAAQGCAGIRTGLSRTNSASRNEARETDSLKHRTHAKPNVQPASQPAGPPIGPPTNQPTDRPTANQPPARVSPVPGLGKKKHPFRI